MSLLFASKNCPKSDYGGIYKPGEACESHNYLVNNKVNNRDVDQKNIINILNREGKILYLSSFTVL